MDWNLFAENTQYRPGNVYYKDFGKKAGGGTK